MARSGDQCPKCNRGRLFVASSIAQGNSQIQYLACDKKCGHTDKRSANVLAEGIRRRNPALFIS